MEHKTDKLIFPRITLAGLKGGSGKTIVSLGLSRLFFQKGLKVKPFKKGPDYIDAKWLSLAAENSASNLDPFLFPVSKVQSLFWSFANFHDIAVIEGNRGLFDGKDVHGSYSTAELCRILQAPVVLVIDCTKVTRTMAAVVLGCKLFEEDLNLAGVILNQTAGQRHRTIIRNSIEQYTDVPVLGALPKIRHNPIPERHMGLISDQEHADLEDIFQSISKLVEDNVDTDKVLEIARHAPCAAPVHEETNSLHKFHNHDKPTIGVVRDKALWFYYEENLEALRQSGAGLIDLTLLDKKDWPEIHGLYLGGGFPETMAQALDENTILKKRLKILSARGLPIYAECGGFMYLAESLEYEDRCFSMAGILPVRTKLFKKPQGHGYVQARVARKNPFYPVGELITGHEFHYSRCLELPDNLSFCFELDRGVGIADGLDGICYRNVLAGYTHIHAFGAGKWAENFVKAALIYKNSVLSNQESCPDIHCQ
ncbi:cobyrinate a,c-diamide synthase [Desulfonatronovibrio magnus]|uniref:cobyrinate a,c-diamide synthase n=1 Tax=Desulfonatronovibrio magnus TaxID=698827 RepID=UPI000A0547A3|nr:cobyrinate a,c-diamide synthase [Desulfonatronovibrio magnus]RQD61809.1 MAG: hydrogenobyrinic acid a,c-diamide synthase (glutamine-hydrolyzing) [Desulfonatronovibrio sp. MSAO_Bac4]